MIVLDKISVTFGKKDAKVKALNEVSLSVSEGELVTITGRSGCGKTTLLNVIGTILRPDSGTYELCGTDVYAQSDKKLAQLRNRKIGFVVQHFALIDNKTVYDNVMLPLKYRKGENISVRKETDILEKLEISDKKRAYPNELSGGQRQRVAIARALISDPDVIIADEPTGALDEKTGEKIMDILKDINKQGKTIIIVTHDPNLAEIGTKRVFMNDGKIEKSFFVGHLLDRG